MYYKSKLSRAVALAKMAGIAVCVMLAGLAGQAMAGGDRNGYENGPAEAGSHHQSVIKVPDTGGVPVRRDVHIGLGKSALIEFPREVRDVLLSNPAAVDAVVLSSNRVFLLARSIGESNAFFFDADGQQFATFELFVERETAGLISALRRMIPGSDI